MVCGVSGSGKSTLVNEVLAKTAAFQLHRSKQIPGESSGIDGLENFDQVVRSINRPLVRAQDRTLQPSLNYSIN